MKLISNFFRLSREIRNIQNEKFEEKKQAKLMELNRIKKEQTDLSASMESKAREVSKLHSNIANHEINERNLRDNLELKIQEKDEIKLAKEQEELSREIGELDPSKLEKEKRDLSIKHNNLSHEKSKISGKISELKVSLVI